MVDGVARRAVVRAFGGPEVLGIEAMPVPEPGRGQVLVRVLAAGLARADVLQRSGGYPRGPRPPYTPGWDAVGVVVSVGPGVRSDLVGCRVVALVLGGGHASDVLARADLLARVPPELDPAEVACLPVEHVTAARLLALADLPPGAGILVHGASGGVGSALLRLARPAGLRAIGTSSPATLDWVASLGAIPLDRRRDDLAAAVRQAAGSPVDAAFVGAGGVEVPRAGDAVHRRGRLVTYGASPDAGAPTRALWREARTLLRWSSDPRRPSVRVFRLSSLARRRPATVAASLRSLVAAMASGELRPRVAARVPLADVARAHELMDSGPRGKVVLIP